MITDNNKQHYLFVKKLNALLKSKNHHNTSYFCIYCLKKITIKLGVERHYQKDC